MSKFDKQRDFNVALAGIRAQGGASKGSFGSCVYRNKWTGRSCAVGQLIPPQRYHESIEGGTCWRPTVFRAIPSFDGTDPTMFGELDGTNTAAREHLWFLSAMQQAHDVASGVDTDAEFLEEFEQNMLLLALDYNLEYTTP
jgi:hypothetical protein